MSAATPEPRPSGSGPLAGVPPLSAAAPEQPATDEAPDPPLGPMLTGGILGAWTAPAVRIGWDVARGTVPDDWVAGLLCFALLSVPVGALGGGFGGGYALSVNESRGGGLPAGWATFGGAFVGGTLLSGTLGLALLVWTLSS